MNDDSIFHVLLNSAEAVPSLSKTLLHDMWWHIDQYVLSKNDWCQFQVLTMSESRNSSGSYIDQLSHQWQPRCRVKKIDFASVLRLCSTSWIHLLDFILYSNLKTFSRLLVSKSFIFWNNLRRDKVLWIDFWSIKK